MGERAIYSKLAQKFGIGTEQVTSFALLYDDGQSVPFIARYRKDKTGGLDDVVLRKLEKELVDERDLAARRQKITDALTVQNALTDELAQRINKAESKLELEEIYAPYRPRRRSLATKANLAGLDVPAGKILSGTDIDTALADYTPVAQITDDTGESIDVDYSTKELQLAGITAIILDKWATHLDLLERVRTGFAKTASIHSYLVSEDKRQAGEKFTDYFDYTQAVSKLPSHRLLAMLRGRQQNVLAIKVVGEDDPFIKQIERHFGLDTHPNGDWLMSVAKKLWQDKWRPQIEHRILTEERLKAESLAIDVFASNLHHLLMSAPAGQRVILGVDPGIRHGVKMAVIDQSGDVLKTQTVYPFTDKTTDNAKSAIVNLVNDYGVELIAIGNGTASRETEALIKETIKDNKLAATALVVSEAGASVYSASEIASSELSELDVSVRGAVSIARRLQDSLSELVKIEPKSIGVGQYQHDVNQTELESSLGKVTEDCVNTVGVDVNTASAAILSYIAGLNKNVAEQIVNYRRHNGAFLTREQLKAVPRLGEKTFEQAAGFLRIKTGDEPLDATGVHPESYQSVYQALSSHNVSIDEAIGNPQIVSKLMATAEPLSPLASALNELGKSRHDPRGTFRTAKFCEDVKSIQDLSVGMELEGVVTNVTAFGCFVDVGIHQDGLVHISQMSDGYVASPSDVVKPFDIVKVRVIDVDEARGRIGFSMKKEVDKSNTSSANDKKFTPAPHKEKSNLVGEKKTKTNRKSNHKKEQKSDTSKLGSFGALLKQAGVK